MAEQAAEPAALPSPKSGKKKLIIAVAVVLIAEAGVIIGLMKFMAGPAPVHAETLADPLPQTEDQQVEEIKVFDGKLFNNKSGATYLYDTEVYIQVRKKNAERVNAELQQFSNEVRSELSAIWRTSEPYHFQEAKLDNLNRKVTGLMNERFGMPPGSTEPIVLKSVIVMSTGFRIDS